MSDPRVVTVGNTLIDHTYHLTNLPGPDEGVCPSVRAATRRRGDERRDNPLPTRSLDGLISCVADDEDGDDLIDRLDSSSIDDLQIHRLPNKRTSYCLVLTDPDGNRAIIGGGESVLELTLTDTDIATIEAADAVFTSAYAPSRRSNGSHRWTHHWCTISPASLRT